MSKPGLNRLSYIDILKVLAAFLIVLLHVSAVYVDVTAKPRWELVYFINAIVRPGLPIFMMISGALLLRPQYNFNFSKKFPYIAKIYFYWSLFYVGFEQLSYAASGNPLLSPNEMIVHWIRGPYHFWYLAMLLGIYIFMPIFSRLKDFATLNYFVWLGFAIIYIIPYVSPFLPDCVNTFIAQMTIFRIGTIPFFFLLGAWLNMLPLDKNLLQLTSFLFTVGVLLTIFQLNTVKNYGLILEDSATKSFSQLFMAIGLFYMIRYACRNHRSSERIKLVSKCTLHIYVTSAFVIYLYQYLIQPHWDALVPFPGLSILIWSVVVFAGSFGLAYLVYRKDRFLKQYRVNKERNRIKRKKR